MGIDKQIEELLVEGRAVIYSDGGGTKESVGAGACVLENVENKRLGIVAFLGPATNNEAELIAGLIGFSYLKAKKPDISEVIWVSDSEYTILGATQYIQNWIKKGWKNSKRKPVANKSLWMTYLGLARGITIWPGHVRGHTGHEQNEACDTASTWAQRNAEDFLTGQMLQEVNIPGTSKDIDWWLLDGRNFILALRGNDSPEKEQAFALVELLKEL